MVDMYTNMKQEKFRSSGVACFLALIMGTHIFKRHNVSEDGNPEDLCEVTEAKLTTCLTNHNVFLYVSTVK